MSDFLQKSLEGSRAARAIGSLRQNFLSAKNPEDWLRIIRSAEELKTYFSAVHASSFDAVVAEAHQRMEGRGPATAADVASLMEETQKANKLNALALSHAKTMEDAAREATDRPDIAAGDIIRMVWNELEPKEKDIAVELQRQAGNMNQTADILKTNFTAVRRCRERLRLLYAGAKMALPAWLLNRDEVEELKKKQDANPGRTTPSGDFVRTDLNDADGLNNF